MFKAYSSVFITSQRIENKFEHSVQQLLCYT